MWIWYVGNGDVIAEGIYAEDEPWDGRFALP